MQTAAQIKDVTTLLQESIPLLSAAFAAGLSRQGAFVFSTRKSFATADEWDRACFAARIYKRGCPEVKHSESGEVRSLTRSEKSLVAPARTLSLEDALLWVGGLSPEVMVIIDAEFSRLNPRWMQALGHGRTHLFLSLESRKTFAAVIEVMHFLENRTQAGVPVDHLVCIGGGLVSDVVGFVAGLLDLTFEVVPTTWLAAVDAGQGGKTGVNFPPYGKNQIGLFHGATRFTLVEEAFETLPWEQKASGLGEALKHCYLMGRYPLEEKNDGNWQYLSCEFLQWNLAVKESVVQSDPHEKNVRKILNLGHTLAHIWEGLAEENKVSPLPHGVAVAMGVWFLAEEGFLLGFPKAYSLDLQKLFEPFKPQVWAPKENLKEAFFRLAFADKKNDSKVPMEPEVQLIIPPYGFWKSKKTRQEDYERRVKIEDLWCAFLKRFG
jgi:3-dehydroquinate synthetase